MPVLTFSRNYEKTNKRKNNSSAKEQHILFQLQFRRNIVIRPADKNEGIVTTDFYEVLPHDSTLIFSNLINSILVDPRDTNKISNNK